jgi:hypothetical protein
MKRLNLIDQKFGRLTVIKLHSIKNRTTQWLCKCECGKKTTVSVGDLRSNHTKSCGCLHQEIINQGKAHFKHGMEGTIFYSKWAGMKRRCLNKNDKKYFRYGGRGIIICDKWLNFNNFRDDMYQSYLEHYKQFGKNTSIDRINVNGNYEPNNCKWSTQKEQTNNMRKNIFITFNGQTLTIKQWAEKLNIPNTTLWNRLNTLHWPIKKAFTNK